MNVFRLVNPGRVDKMIAFDTLPKRLCSGIKTKDLKGYPRYWRTWLKEHDAVHTVKRWNTQELKHDEVEETFTYVLDMMVNEDKEKWQAITNYVRKAVDLSVRLMDKMDDMAIPLAKDSYTEINIEPEQVPVIPVPLELIKGVQELPQIVEVEKKKPGRPKKVAVEV